MNKPITRGRATTVKATRRLSLLATPLVVALAMSGFALQALAQETQFDKLAERALNRGAIEAVIWGMPAGNAQLMFDAAKKSGGDFNQIRYCSRPLTCNNHTLTPNPTTN